MSKETKTKESNRPISSTEMPQRSLEQVIEIPQLIYKNFAGGETPLNTIATIVGISEKSTNMGYAIKAAEAYGIIDKMQNGQFKLSEVGRKIVAPTYAGEDKEAIRQAIMTPTLMSKFYSDYDKHPIPEANYFLNSLEQKYGIPKAKAPEIKEILMANAKFADILVVEKNSQTQLINLNTPLTKGVELTVVKPTTILDAIDYSPVYSTSQGSDFLKTCFVISPIGSDDSEERKHANMMLKHLIKPVCEELEIDVVRADTIDKSGLITHQILEHIAKAAYCITDLSFNNPNVFYELGVRHVCQLPTIQIIRKGDKIPFDVSQGRTIIIDTSDLYTIMDRFESARKELTEHLRKLKENSKNDIADDNPIKVYLPDLKVTLPKR